MRNKLLLMLVFLAASICCGAQSTVVKETRATLSISATPSSASIYVYGDGGKYNGKGKWSGKLKAGTYTIEVSCTGYQSYKKDVTLTKGGTKKLPISLQKEKEEDVRATLSISATPSSASIYVHGDGGEYNGKGKWSGKLKAGKYKIKVSCTGYQSYEKDVTLTKGGTKKLPISLQKEKGEDVRDKIIGGNQIATSSSTVRKYTVGGVSFEMVKVSGGTFTMGASSSDSEAYDWEKPAHLVTLSPYWIGRTEVTQALWKAVMGSEPSYFKGDDLPVESVSWEDCKAFVGKLGELTGARFALPTEAEWEYAARGGSRSKGCKYSGSDKIDEVAWYDGNSGGKTHPVGKKAANELGLYDMTGNVWEWCADWYGGYTGEAQTNPTGPSSASSRVDRGGSWGYGALGCRVSFRGNRSPGDRSFDLGLRLSIREQ